MIKIFGKENLAKIVALENVKNFKIEGKRFLKETDFDVIEKNSLSFLLFSKEGFFW